MAYTPRQSQILESLSRQMGFGLSEITNVGFEADIPTQVTYRNNRGTFTRQTYDQLGAILTNMERDQLRQLNSREQQQLSTAYLASQALLGRSSNPRFSDFAYSNGRTPSLANVGIQAARLFDPKTARLVAAGLGMFSTRQLTSQQGMVSFAGADSEDRVRISDPSGLFINPQNEIMQPLVDTGYVLFPYTPSITVNHSANYTTENPAHSNYNYQFYQNSATATISITATFTAKDEFAAAYVLAVQHFFRSVTKMFYGRDPEAGTPPPVLRLDGHGDYQFSSVPIVITEFSVTLPTDVDYISTTAVASGPSGAGVARTTKVPVMQEFAITCAPVYSRKSISNSFSLRDFAAGKLLGTEGGRGGFI